MNIIIISNVLYMQNNGKEILWSHLVSLYYKNHSEVSGLLIVPKLKYEHIYLTSHSKMRVDLVTQVAK